MDVHIANEYDVLKKVLVFRPGPEVESCFPGPYGDTHHVGKYKWPHKKVAQEHDSLIGLMTASAEVFDVRRLLEEVLIETPSLIRELLGRSWEAYLEYYSRKIPEDPKCLVEDVIMGVPRTLDDTPRITPPLQYATWVRDWGTVLGDSVSLWPVTKRRLPAGKVLRAIVNHHPLFAQARVFDFLEDPSLHIEGGDVIPLSKGVMAIGVGARTDLRSAKRVSQILVGEGLIELVYIVEIPKLYEVLHQDQVFGMLGPESALVLPYVFDEPEPYKPLVKILEQWIDELPFSNASHKVWVVDRETSAVGQPYLTQLRQDGFLSDIVWIGGERENHDSTLEHLRVAFVEAARQAGNTFCLSAFNIVGYDGVGPYTEEVLQQYLGSKGGHLTKITCGWLGKSGGGPHCLIMPLQR